MPVYTSFSTSVMIVDKPITSTFMYQLTQNVEWAKMAWAYNVTSRAPNSEFEFVNNDTPHLWSCSTVTNGMVGVSTEGHSGGHSLQFVMSGERYSGGEAWSDYVPVTTLSTLVVSFYTWGAQVNMNAWLYYYAGDFTTLGSSRIYSASARGASWHVPTAFSVTPVGFIAGSRWVRLMFVNETSASDTVAGNVHFDGIQITPYG